MTTFRAALIWLPFIAGCCGIATAYFRFVHGTWVGLFLTCTATLLLFGAKLPSAIMAARSCRDALADGRGRNDVDPKESSG